MTLQRTLTRVSTRTRLGPDAQVDDKALAFVPTEPALTDPFLALAEDWFSTPGFEWHPHRGLETVTLVLDGVLEHGDNLGHAGALEPGEVQWMTAGRGIIHRELAYRNEHAHVLQLWLNLPAAKKMTASRYQDLTRATTPRVHTPGVVLDVHAGTVDGVTGAADTHTSVQGVHVIAGPVIVGGRTLDTGQIGWSDPGQGTSLHLAAPDGDTPARVMVYSGTPMNETVALGGPFVMNTKPEIAQAFRDFHAGAFGPVPRLARLNH
jgi:redox-sensitive bicupin YhaK (pirin superfamily)